MSVAGAVAGEFALTRRLWRRGRRFLRRRGERIQSAPFPCRAPRTRATHTALAGDSTRGKAFVDFQNDVTDKDVELAEREGFRAVEHLKRYTTLGMATDQGRTANVNALAIMAEITGRTIPQTGITVARPPYARRARRLAGHHRGKHFKATRLPPSYAWAKEQGGVCVETGLWLRPSYFPQKGERDWLQTVTREVNTVRSAVGICDVSTLGKWMFRGPTPAFSSTAST